MRIDGNQLRFGIHSGQQNASFDEYLAIWRLAEEVGFEWASVFDHFQPIQSDPTGPCFEGLTLLSAMAAHTTRLRCGIIVSGVTYRNPGVLAKIAATIDHVSGGRMELGVGAAWNQAEHDQYDIPFPRIGVRLDMLDDACRILRALWTEPRATVDGRRLSVHDALCEPKPLQHPMPLWIGGSGEKRTLRIVAEHATGWNTFFGDPAQFRHKLDVLERHCGDVGRDPAEIRKQIVMVAVLGATEAEAHARARDEGPNDSRVIGTPEQCVELLRPYRELGVGDFLVLARPPLDERTITLFAREVAPALRAA
ncbi:TIGR03560 family F420-dependent LLM class oxidoreductase [Candidatus Solirubrobacter pratensis]|uniref:TIGR03560 family F420-dependent LLM class oxidoreductase n=1 Tax=Candidatus Solirubrobacter pratensis TaxID=1298857 RepID=UPI0004235751|nr:TIGR03560 family F420-dependent LLM class oxidoreductase [Candidatus Solirubrobacter pratensis]